MGEAIIVWKHRKCKRKSVCFILDLKKYMTNEHVEIMWPLFIYRLSKMLVGRVMHYRICALCQNSYRWRYKSVRREWVAVLRQLLYFTLNYCLPRISWDIKLICLKMFFCQCKKLLFYTFSIFYWFFFIARNLLKLLDAQRNFDFFFVNSQILATLKLYIRLLGKIFNIRPDPNPLTSTRIQ